MILKYWLIFFIILTILFFNGCVIQEEVDLKKSEKIKTPTYPQKFYIEENKIVDESGNEVVFRGVSALDPVWQYYTASESGVIPWSEDYYKTMSEWEVKIVRLPIHPGAWRKYGKNESLLILDKTLELIKKYEMYTIIDFHGIGFPPTEEYEANLLFPGAYHSSNEETIDFWNEISLRYKDNKVVAFYEIFNEPVYRNFVDQTYEPPWDEDWVLWKNWAEKIIDQIRVNDPDSVIIVGGLSWAYDLSYVLFKPIERINIVYGTHPYPDSNWKKTWEDAFGDVKSKYPVFVTEFGFDATNSIGKPESAYSGPGRYRDTIKFYLESKNISWTAWVFSSIWEPALLKDRDYTPTEEGQFFKDWLSIKDKN